MTQLRYMDDQGNCLAAPTWGPDEPPHPGLEYEVVVTGAPVPYRFQTRHAAESFTCRMRALGRVVAAPVLTPVPVLPGVAP